MTGASATPATCRARWQCLVSDPERQRQVCRFGTRSWPLLRGLGGGLAEPGRIATPKAGQHSRTRFSKPWRAACRVPERVVTRLVLMFFRECQLSGKLSNRERCAQAWIARCLGSRVPSASRIATAFRWPLCRTARWPFVTPRTRMARSCTSTATSGQHSSRAWRPGSSTRFKRLPWRSARPVAAKALPVRAFDTRTPAPRGPATGSYPATRTTAPAWSPGSVMCSRRAAIP